MGIKRKERQFEVVGSNINEQTSNPKIKKFKEDRATKSAEFEKKSILKNVDAKKQKKVSSKKSQGMKKDFHKNKGLNIISTEPNEKVDWKKLKIEKKELKIKRKQKGDKESGNDSYVLGVKAKKIWEEVRREDCKGERKKELTKQLYQVIKGKAKGLIFAHDTVRVIETLVSVGEEEYRTALFEELKDDLHALTKNKYARFFVLKLLRYGPKYQKDAIIASFKGHVIDFMKHKVACDVVELAYNDFANSKQRSSMMQEFFGPQFRLFKDEEIHSLEDAIKKHPANKEMILKDVNTSLQAIIDKGVFTNTMIHTLMKQYLSCCSDADKTAVIESVKEHLLPIIHTRDGARVAMICLWYGTNKDRKIILKSFKGHYQKIATEEFGFMVLLAALDCVDDTVFLKKAVLSELLSDVKYLIASDGGRKVLKYLVAPRSKLFFHPDILKVLIVGDSNATSKKDPEVRRKEICAAISEPILQEINENILKWAFDCQWTLFVGAALKTLSGPILKEIFEKLTSLCSISYIPGENEHFLEVSHTTKLISYIIQSDKERVNEGGPVFCTMLIEEAGSEMPGWTLTNRGCFLLVKMIETDIKEVAEKVLDIISLLKKRLQKLDTAGAKILCKKLE